MVRWHHQLYGHESEQASGVGDGQGSLACCSPRGCKKPDIIEWLNWTEQKLLIRERKCLKTQRVAPGASLASWLLRQHWHTRWVILGRKAIDRNLEERQISKQIHGSLTQLKKNISIRETHWLAQGLRKVKFRWNQVTTQKFKRNLLICIEKGEKRMTLVVCFLLPLKRERKKSLTLAVYFLSLGTPRLACYPLTFQGRSFIFCCVSHISILKSFISYYGHQEDFYYDLIITKSLNYKKSSRLFPRQRSWKNISPLGWQSKIR